MCADTLLVTGIHREELAFGDHVAARVTGADIDVMRIPHGVPQARTGTGDHFYSDTRHREIYLQLRQQVKGRYRLLIDLHCGLDESGTSADVFCHDEGLLECLAAHAHSAISNQTVRMIKIVDDGEPVVPERHQGIVAADARTWIPRRIWDDNRFLYVGLEIYLPDNGEGAPSDWEFALRLIELTRSCGTAEPGIHP